MVPHRRQFVLGPAAMAEQSGWRADALGPGVVLAYHEALPVVRHDARALLGIAVQTEPGRDAPEAELARREGLDTETWAGRWLLVDGQHVRQDAAGTMACYMRRTAQGIWIASSAALLRRVEPALTAPPARLVHAQGMDWFPPPAAGTAGIERLLPSQVLDLDGRRARRRLVAPARTTDYQTLLDAVAGRLVAGVRALAARSGAVSVPLSGGRDSRLLLAAAAAAGVDATAHTFDVAGMSRADRELPARLARRVGIPHRFITSRGVDAQRLRVFDEHTAGETVDVDRQLYARGMWDGLPEGVDLGGGVFEAARCYYQRVLPAEQPRFGAVAMAEAIEVALPTRAGAALRAWSAWTLAAAEEPIDWRDRFYIEQRVGGWLAAIGQALDLVDPPRVHLGSCAVLLGELLAMPATVRRTGLHQEHLVERLEPALAGVPVNPSDSLPAAVAARARRELDLLRAAGRADRYAATRLRQLAARRGARRLGGAGRRG